MAKRIILFLTSLLLCLGLPEIVLRVTGLYETQSEKCNSGFINPYIPQHTGWQYHHTPNQTVLQQLPEFAYEFRYDSLGYRNDTPADSADILAFGDSFTEGVGTPQDSTWPALLQSKTGMRVYNAGAMGSDPAYYLIALKHTFIQMHPKMILVMLNYSDIYDVLVRGGMERFETDSNTHYKKEPWFMPAYQYAHTFRAFLHLVLRYDFMFNSPSARGKNISISLQTIADILQQMKNICDTKNIEFYVYLHPIPQEYYKLLDSRTDFKRIDELCPLLESRGIYCINLRPYLERKLYSAALWKLVSWSKDGHFNRLGYDAIADIIANHGFPGSDDKHR